MAWETRGNGRYYYRSVRDGTHVRKEYFGFGRMATLCATLMASDRRELSEELRQWKADRAALDALDAPLDAFYENVDLITTVYLEAAGYHRHKRGEWRKRRGKSEG